MVVPEERLPRALGPLRLERRLGAGGMGTVYAATLAEACAGLEPGRRVAAKVFRDDCAGPGADARALERLRREALVGTQVDHPAVVRTHELIEASEDGHVRRVLVMELVEGTTLRHLVEEMGALPEPLVRHVGLQLARALEAVHALGVVHRDVKPENVLVGADHQVKLSDLGIARPLDATSQLTTTGAFLGSVAYASPEHFGAGELSPASDLYSLGVVLHEAACGRRPFEDATLAGLIRRHVEQRPRRLGEIVPEVSPFLEELVAALLEKDPARRPSTASEVALALADGESSAWWRARDGQLDEDAVRTVRLRRRRGPRMVGRDEELARLVSAAREAFTGQGGVVLLEGEAGVGKSRLLDELADRLGEGDEPALVLRGDAMAAMASGRGAIAESLVARFGEAGLPRLLDEHLATSPGVARALASWALNLPPPPGSVLTRDVLHAGLARVAASLASQRPVAWLVEDLHLATPEERALFVALARAARRQRVLLVASLRTGAPLPELAHDRLEVARVALPRLSARAVVDLLAQALGSQRLAEDLGGRIAARTDGNPFFVLEVVRDLQQKGVVARADDGSWSLVGRVSAIEVPTSVRSLMLERAAALGPDERAIVDAAAVQGFHFDGDLVAEVLGTTRLATLQSLAAVERRTGLVRASGRRYQFDHHQLQEVLRAAIPEPLAVEYHALLAKALDARMPREGANGDLAARLVPHALEGRLLDLAERHLATAFVQLRTRLQNEAAIELALLARERFPDPSPARSLAGTRLAYTYELLGRSAEALAIGERAVAEADACGDLVASSQARHALATVLSRASRFDDAAAVALRGRDEARRAGAGIVETKHVATLGTIAALSGRMEDARVLFREAAVRFAELGSAGDEAIALGNLSQALVGTGSDEALPLARRSLALAERAGDSLQAIYAQTCVGALLLDGGGFAEAREHLAQGAERARAFGAARLEASVLQQLGALESALGRLDAAAVHLERGLHVAESSGDHRVRGRLLADLAELRLARGDVAGARETLPLALSAELRAGSSREESHVRLVAAAFELVHGTREAAAEQAALARDRVGAGADARFDAWAALLLDGPPPDPARVAELPLMARLEALAVLAARDGTEARADLEREIERAAGALEAADRAAFLEHGAPARLLALASAPRPVSPPGAP